MARMEREIKFRGINRNSNHWVYGCFVRYPNGGVAICNSEGSAFEVYPYTVGQYTGLKDKNGTEIYEGDILIDEYFDLHLKMVWFDGCFKLHGKGFHLPDVIPAYERLQLGGVKIVGNIHNNPELYQ